MKTRISNRKRLLLKYLLLPWCRAAVGNREASKSFLIKVINGYRHAFWLLAERMAVREGRIPEPELLFFLKFEEVERLVRVRDTALVIRAVQRRKAFQSMNRLQFDEIVHGPDFAPKPVGLLFTALFADHLTPLF